MFSRTTLMTAAIAVAAVVLVFKYVKSVRNFALS